MQGKMLDSIKRHLEGHKPYIMARRIKGLFDNRIYRKVVSLKPMQSSRGNVLLSYIIDPFLLKPGQPISHAHTHYWESFQIAMTWLDLGYSVDIISHRNNYFIPQKEYAFFTGARQNFERISTLLNKNCVKIMHIDISHILFHDAGQSKRLLELQQRRGVTLRHRKFESVNMAVEHADCATMLGNEFTSSTYEYAKKPIYLIPISTPFLYPWPEAKDFEACRRHFLWFGSGGMVHKGLDLVLDVFAELPAYHLTICGPVQDEEDFERAYYKELYQTPNIHTVGWIDIGQPDFTTIANSCVGLVYPSCSEGQAGSVVTCLHAGLIPIISYQSGVNIDEDFGVVLRECSIKEIKQSIERISRLPARELKKMARSAWEFARTNHTRERFAEEYRSVVGKIVEIYHSNKDG